MFPVNSYEGMIINLSEGLKERYKRNDVNLTGILFARPETTFVRDEILPHIDYWHHRSDHYTDFFCPGYLPKSHPLCSGKYIVTVGKDDWYFDNASLTKFLEEFDKHTSWRYTAGCELIVCNVRRDPATPDADAYLDLTSAVAIDLEHARNDKAFRDVSDLVETIFEAAKRINESESDPCWEWSDRHGMRVIKRSLKELLLSFLPAWLKPEAKRAFHYVAQDLSVKAN